MVVDFGKYKSISQSAGLYKVTDEDKNSYLINGSNKKIADLNNSSINTYIGVNEYSILKEDSSYTLLNMNGDKILKFDKAKSDDDPKTSNMKGFVSVFYNKKVYIANYNTSKEITSFDADVNYCINTVEKDGKIIILNSCESAFGNSGETTYRLIKDNKYYDLSDKCEKLGYSNESIICTNGSNKNELTDKLEVGLDINSQEYKMKNGYAKEVDYSVVFYGTDGKELNTVKCRDLSNNGAKVEGFYILTTHFNRSCGTDFGTYEFYNEKGENIFDKSFSSAKAFDTNKLAQVSENKGSYYLIDLKGKKVSDEYSEITLSNEYYIAKSDDKKAVLDKTGSEIVSGEYKSVSITKTNKDTFALFESEDNYVIYNLASKKEVMNSDKKPSIQKHYITVSNDGKTEYYTFSGKKFY